MATKIWALVKGISLTANGGRCTGVVLHRKQGRPVLSHRAWFIQLRTMTAMACLGQIDLVNPTVSISSNIRYLCHRLLRINDWRTIWSAFICNWHRISLPCQMTIIKSTCYGIAGICQNPTPAEQIERHAHWTVLNSQTSSPRLPNQGYTLIKAVPREKHLNQMVGSKATITFLATRYSHSSKAKHQSRSDLEHRATRYIWFCVSVWYPTHTETNLPAARRVLLRLVLWYRRAAFF